MAPAFHSVDSRRSLGSTHFNGGHVAHPVQPKKHEWSPSVREYVQRCFAPEAAIPGITREMMETKLKLVLTEAAETEKIHTIDWDTHPSPQQLILQERANPAHLLWGAQISTPTNMTPMRPEIQIPGPKKRRLDEHSTASSEPATPPWRRSHQNVSNSFEDKKPHTKKNQADHVGKKQRKIQSEPMISSKFQEDLQKRRQRFELDKPGHQSPGSWRKAEEDEDIDNGPVIGTCQKLEKNYFRLTSAPKASEVRPLPVLEKTLDFLKKKWRTEGNYGYICDQFKSLRQDLTVQHIKNSFTVDVYELHARIALEKGDMGEYNQCQTQLRALYSLELGGHPAEFLAYRVLYFLHTANRSGLNDILADITPADKEKPAVKHALAARSALALGNYHRFFRLYLDVPNMGAYLMDKFVVRERLAALANMCKAFKPKLNIRYLTEELGFESHQETAQFIVDHGAQDALKEENDGAEANLVLITAMAAQIFDAAQKQAFQTVDIKGQI